MMKVLSIALCLAILIPLAIFSAGALKASTIAETAVTEASNPTESNTAENGPQGEPEPDDYRNIIPYFILLGGALLATAAATLLIVGIIFIVTKVKRKNKL